ncbi:amino acid adenylation domain-containing protein [Rhodococcus sp. IEGM 1379]|uniref:amino acid adenylation domain-containing protein n=1 Tax=Rhodococcus sp. IEGM 1379 TaxID=3047086 RepID=UPI0024B7B3D5|nr:amino acid adenylation domain-containing protein [Rhodococcus sp. IEGM 1379]MDI9913862.1 amino acid adenylation domain-containing protein [Rhodococcus sp. IEGM 1379]
MTSLTAAQRSLWFAQTLDPTTPYVIAQYAELTGELDADRLESATVIAHREFGIAGLHLRVTDGVPELHDDANTALVGERLDFRRFDNPVEAATSWMQREWSTATPSSDQPLTIANLLRVGPDRWFWYYRAHHIALDGYTAALLMRRTTEIYLSAETLNIERATPTDPGHVEAIAAQERRYRESQRCTRDREFWREKLESMSSPPTLGTRDETCAQGRTIRMSGTVPLPELSATDAISAFASYVARLSGVDDVCLSLPVSARVTAASRSMAGAMSNVIPLVLPGIGSTTPAQAISTVGTALGQALRHQLFRREDIARLADSGKQSAVRSFGPVVNVMMFDATLTLGEIRGHVEILTTGPVYDLALNVYPGYGGGVRIDLEANEALYTRPGLAAHHERFLRFLQAFVGAQRIESACQFPAMWTERELAAKTPARGACSLTPTSLDSLLRSVVEQSSDSCAITDGNRAWTYEQLDRMAGIWGRHLQSAGVSSDDVVAVAIPRSMESVLAMWAVARAGATYVPIDPTHPSERLETILGDCHPKIGLTVSSMITTLPRSIEWLALDHEADCNLSPSHDTMATHPDHRAYMIFTSGSTGRPKAVAVTHRGLANLACDIRDKYQLAPNSVVLHCASTSFDTAVVEILAPALFGATLMICPPDIVGGTELEELTCRSHVTHLFVTPSALATIAPEHVPELRFLVVGGEKVPPALVRRWASSVRVRSAYGPTETTCSVTTTDILTAGDRVTLGRLMHGVQAVVLDASLLPLSTGAAGELYLSGPGLARGYDGRAGETAAQFVASTFAPGNRMFRTGDRVRWTTDGQLEFLGRTDDQVKLRGRRIELGEVDAVLYGHSSVEFATTVVRELPNGSSALVSYVKLHPEAPKLDKSIEHLLAQKLPDYMIPIAVVRIEKVPLTTNKKVDRLALPAPTVERSGTAGASTPSEARIVRIFQDILTVTGVGPEDSFFELGGDSLSATRVISRVNAEFGTDVGVRDLFESPTAATLADALGPNGGSAPPLRRVTGPATALLSPAQQTICRELTTPALYNLPFTIRVRGKLDRGAFSAAVQDVLIRHETLRTVYPDIDGSTRPVVVPIDQIPVELPTLDGNSHDVDTIIRDTLSRGFDVRSEIPVRMLVCTYSHDDHLVAAVVHHIAADGWSLAVIARDLSIAYESRVRKSPPTWPAIDIRYSDYAHWREILLGSERSPTELATRQLDYWTAVLADAPREISLPLDHTRPTTWTFRADRIDFSLERETHVALKGCALDSGTGMFTVVHAVLVATLSALTGDHDLVIGTPIAGRGHPKLDHLVGMFVNTLALRTRIDVTTDFQSLVAECRGVELSAHENSEVPLESLIEHLDPPRSTSLHPFFQVAMSFENFPTAVLESDGLTFEITPRPLDIAKCDLHFHFTEVLDPTGAAAGLDATLVYSADLFDSASGALFVKALCVMADAVAFASNAPLQTVRQHLS